MHEQEPPLRLCLDALHRSNFTSILRPNKGGGEKNPDLSSFTCMCYKCISNIILHM
jgi:hypothetical protein